MNTIGQMNMGMNVSKPKVGKPVHRGRKPSGKPGAQHLSALTTAHGKGDLQGAKSAALNYAKAVHSHMNAAASVVTGGADEPDMDESMPMQPGVASLGAPAVQSSPASGMSMARAAMMKRMKSR